MSSSTLDTTAITDALNDVGRRLSEAAESATSFPETKKLFEAPPVKKILDADNGAKLTEELLDALLVTNKGTLTRLGRHGLRGGMSSHSPGRLRAPGEEREIRVRHLRRRQRPRAGARGFVGAGLLTAAVCGDVFASPSAKAVLAAIVATSSPRAGCLLIVKNYTGDRLNFGIAAETAKSRYGIPVETVYVADDVALDSGSNARGVAGTLLVHKAAGAAAAAAIRCKTSPRRPATLRTASRPWAPPTRSARCRAGRRRVDWAPGRSSWASGSTASPGSKGRPRRRLLS